MPEMSLVESSNVRAIGHDDDILELWVEFNDGSIYVYEGVPAVIYEELMDAPSKGSYLNRVIKGNFAYRRS
jgi:hypothetical protein